LVQTDKPFQRGARVGRDLSVCADGYAAREESGYESGFERVRDLRAERIAVELKGDLHQTNDRYRVKERSCIRNERR